MTDNIKAALEAAKKLHDADTDRSVAWAARDRIINAAVAEAASPAEQPKPQQGQVLSIDISDSDNNYDYRIYAELTGEVVQTTDGNVWLAEKTGANFTAAPAPASSKPEVDEEAEILVTCLRGFGKAYPEDMFLPMSMEEADAIHKAYPGIVDRISAGMGRHCAKFMQQAAEMIEKLMRCDTSKASEPELPPCPVCVEFGEHEACPLCDGEGTAPVWCKESKVSKSTQEPEGYTDEWIKDQFNKTVALLGEDEEVVNVLRIFGNRVLMQFGDSEGMHRAFSEAYERDKAKREAAAPAPTGQPASNDKALDTLKAIAKIDTRVTPIESVKAVAQRVLHEIQAQAAPTGQAQPEPLSDAEFLSKRLARVAELAGFEMPNDMTHEQIAEVAGTILGFIARKLEAGQPAPASDIQKLSHEEALSWLADNGVGWGNGQTVDPYSDKEDEGQIALAVFDALRALVGQPAQAVTLTDDEIDEMATPFHTIDGFKDIEFARAIERRLLAGSAKTSEGGE